MGCCFGCSKVILFLLNFLFVLIGLVIFAIGVWTAVDSESILETIAFFSKSQASMFGLYANTDFIRICAGVLIVIGVLIFILSFIGCWVVVSENRILLIVYTVLMCLVVLLEVIVVILLFALKGTWEPKLTAELSRVFSTKYVGTMGAFQVTEFEPFSLAADAFMIQFSCCGINGAQDFDSVLTTSRWHKEGRTYFLNGQTYKDNEVALPTACCKFTSTKFFSNQMYNEYAASMNNSECPVAPPKSFNALGCKDVIPMLVNEHKVPIIVVPVILLLLELICTGLAIGLTVIIKRLDDELYY